MLICNHQSGLSGLVSLLIYCELGPFLVVQHKLLCLFLMFPQSGILLSPETHLAYSLTSFWTFTNVTLTERRFLTLRPGPHHSSTALSNRNLT